MIFFYVSGMSITITLIIAAAYYISLPAKPADLHVFLLKEDDALVRPVW